MCFASASGGWPDDAAPPPAPGPAAATPPSCSICGRSQRHISTAALTSDKPGERSRAIYRTVVHRDNETGEHRGFAWIGSLPQRLCYVNTAFTEPADPMHALRRRLSQAQYRFDLINECLIGTGLALVTAATDFIGPGGIQTLDPHRPLRLHPPTMGSRLHGSLPLRNDSDGVLSRS